MKCKRMNTQAWSDFLKKGLSENAYPCYAAAVGRESEIFFREMAGNRACFPNPLPLTEQTLFDMASFSKLIGTAMPALRLIERDRLSLSNTLGDYFGNCYGKERITVKQLMTHTSGIIPYFNMENMDISPEEAVDVILSNPLVAPPGEKVIYSCMGYILLGKILELVCGVSLDMIVKNEVLNPLNMSNTHYCPDSTQTCVSTEKKANLNEYINGYVHDENARFLGGVSGNSGVFSTFDDVIKFAKMLSYHGKGYLNPETFALSITNHTKNCVGEPRGLGFQLVGNGASPAGSIIAKGSYGHTGFTGVSVYVEKESGIFCVLLTNRIHFGRDNDSFFAYRRCFYDKVFADLKGMNP